MTNARLLKFLKKHGVIHQEQHGFCEMVHGIKNDARIVCAEIEEKRGYSGICFWLYGERQNWYLGLWSGVYFRVTNPEIIEEMVLELYSGNPVPKGKVPFTLPLEFIQKYGLILLEDEHPKEPNASEQL